MEVIWGAPGEYITTPMGIAGVLTTPDVERLLIDEQSGWLFDSTVQYRPYCRCGLGHRENGSPLVKPPGAMLGEVGNCMVSETLGCLDARLS